MYPNYSTNPCQITYHYDADQRLQQVTDWQTNTLSYSYDGANRLQSVSLPNGITSHYSYNEAGQLTRLSHTDSQNNPIASYDYSLNQVGQRTHLTETVLAPAYFEATEVTNGDFESGDLENWEQITPGITVEPGPTAYQGVYGAKLLGHGRIDQKITTKPGQTYQLSAYVRLDAVVVEPTWGGVRIQVADFETWKELGRSGFLNAGSHPFGQTVPVGEWVHVSFSFTARSEQAIVGLTNFSDGEFLASADNIQVRLLLTTQPPLARSGRATSGPSQTYLPLIGSGSTPLDHFALAEQELRWQQACATGDCPPLPTALAEAYGVYTSQPKRQTRASTTPADFTPHHKTIAYHYDSLYRLTEASYSTDDSYSYRYDGVGNRLEQIINGDTTSYTYDAANRLATVTDHQSSVASYSYDNNGNLLQTGSMTNSWDSANRLIETTTAGATVQPLYDGLGNRVGQTDGISTTHYALDVGLGLPEIIYTSEGTKYLHLPGVIVTENITGETRYLLSDGLGSIRHVVDETGAVVSYQEYDPYGNPIVADLSGYGYTGEWWENDIGLLHLRARWYLPETGTFLSRDPVESEPPYQYVRGNTINWTDPSGKIPQSPACLVLIVADGPFPIGDVLTIPCIIAATLFGAVILETLPDVEAPDISVPIDEWADWTGEDPDNDPSPRPVPTVPPIPYNQDIDDECDDDNYDKNVLIVGDGNFSYSNQLAIKEPNWKITGTNYGDGSNSQTFRDSYGNLTLYTNVDAKNLDSGSVTGKERYDAIVFNNPHTGNRQGNGQLISAFIQSARMILSPSAGPRDGIHINVTAGFIRSNRDVLPVLGLPDKSKTTLNNLNTFGQTDFYVPYVPEYTTGGAIRGYEDDPTLVAGLKNFIFH